MRVLVAAFLLLSASASAQTVNVPQVMGYQGRLLKDGSPETGQLSIIFRIFDTEIGGELKWTETQTVQLTNGFYAVFLGSTDSTKPESEPKLAASFDGNPRWLELQIEGDSAPLTPRQQIASVAYALRASNVSGNGVVSAASASFTGDVTAHGFTGPLNGNASSATAATNVSGAGTVNARTGSFTSGVSAASFTGPLNGNASSATTATNVSGAGTVNASSGTFTGGVSAGNFNGPLNGKASSAGYADSAGSAGTVPGRVVGGCQLNMNGNSTALQGSGCDCWNADCSTVRCSSSGCTDPTCPTGSDLRQISHGNCYTSGQGYCRNYLCIQR
jgi:hypothetical protein